MRELGKAVRSTGRIYFTGGVSAVLLGWREMTIDVDLKADPEPIGFFECLPVLKDRLKELFLSVEVQVLRYPAIDAPTLKQRVLDVCAE